MSFKPSASPPPDMNAKRFSLVAAITALLIAVCLLARSAETSFSLPPETAKLKPGPGSDLAVANCSLCHSADYIGIQPRFPRPVWKAEVTKMQQKWRQLHRHQQYRRACGLPHRQLRQGQVTRKGGSATVAWLTSPSRCPPFRPICGACLRRRLGITGRGTSGLARWSVTSSSALWNLTLTILLMPCSSIVTP